MTRAQWTKFSKEEIIAILNESTNVSDLIKRIGYSTIGGKTIKQIDKMLKFHGIDLPDYCNESHFSTPQPREKVCAICGETFVIETVTKWRRKYCYNCSPSTNNPTAKTNAMRTKVIQMRGGKCERCGYDRCIDALEFHHLDPSKKDFKLANTGGVPSFEKFLEESKKCALLCANCHREEHWRLRQNN